MAVGHEAGAKNRAVITDRNDANGAAAAARCRTRISSAHGRGPDYSALTSAEARSNSPHPRALVAEHAGHHHLPLNVGAVLRQPAASNVRIAAFVAIGSGWPRVCTSAENRQASHRTRTWVGK